MKIKVLIVDDHKIVRNGLKTLLENNSNIEIIGEGENGRIAIELAQKLKPNVIIMDIAMPELNGIDASEQILKNNPDIKIIILSMHSDKTYIAKAFKVGVLGFLLKDCDIDEIINAIKTVSNHKHYLSPMINDKIIEDYKDLLLQNDKKENNLSTREKEVLQLISEGNTTKEIAKIMNISIKTVESHRQQIMDKLQIRSIAGLTRYAIKEGIITDLKKI